MKEITCLVCKTDFYGRNNQIFCSSDCKNKHYNQKTRLIYRVGRLGSNEISNIQEQVYNDQARILKIDTIFNEETAKYKAEIDSLKSDYTNLLNNYEKFKNDVEKIREKYVNCMGSAKKSEEQLNLITGLMKMFGPEISKIVDNLGKIEKNILEK